jgi:hypothetical protein
MQGALYFPYIAVPESAWLTRTLLYWDSVGTVIPRSHIYDPDLLDPHTRLLIQNELVYQVLPHQADHGMAAKFGRYLSSLDHSELSRRREFLKRGYVSRVNQDKFIVYGAGLNVVQQQGLCRPFILDDEWILVETTTASEFMAALALGLCHPASEWASERQRQGLESSWVPVTDRAAAIDGLLGGLATARTDTPGERELTLRVDGLMRSAELRSMMIDRLLPVPAEPVSIDQLLRFRRRHGSLLPSFRRHLEALMDEALTIEDETLRFRKLDRIIEEADERATQAESYMKESGIRRFARSALLKLLKFVPFLHDPVETAQEIAEATLRHPNLASEPLAYLAFARAEFSPITRYRVDPFTGTPLIQAMS